MNSIGNNIVDLRKVNFQRTKQPYFYTKILAPSELDLFQETALLAFEHYVWILWSIKESVYKFEKRKTPDVVFIPDKIVATALKSSQGRELLSFGETQKEYDSFNDHCSLQASVCFEGKQFFTHSFLWKDLIHTVATERGDGGNVQWGIKHIADENYPSQSKEVRSFFLERASLLFDRSNLLLEKNKIGYPNLLIDGREANIPLSFSHHGHFVAYAFQQTAVQTQAEPVLIRSGYYGQKLLK